MSGRGKAWNPEEDAYLRDHYRLETFEEMGAALGRSPGGVQDRCYKLELFSKKWTQQEKEYIADAWGQTSITAMSKKLNRSVNAIKIMADRMGLGRHLDAGEMVTFFQVIQAVTCGTGSYSWLRQKWEKYDFPFHRKKVITKSFLMVDLDEFWIWAEKHRDILDFSKFEEYALGAEPAWVKKKRHQDYRKMHRDARPWTKADDQRLRFLLEAQKYGLDEIAAKLSRKEGAIRRRIDTLGIKHRPIRNPGKWWTQEEINALLQMHKEGHSFEEIGEKIGRTASACRGRYERILNPDSMTREVRNNKAALREFFQRHQCSHFTKAGGCDIRGTNCDECTAFVRRNPAETYTTGWISSKAGTDGQLRIMEVNT